MTYTLLELVQLILSAMDSEEVNDISETVESAQVALLLKSVFYDCATDLELPEHEGFFELNASLDITKPTLMTTPTNVIKVRDIKYDYKLTADTNRNFNKITFMSFNDFLTMQNGIRENDDTGEMTFTSNGEDHHIMYATDRMPVYYTTFDDRTYIFDAYDSTEDTTLQKAKTLCSGVVYPAWSHTNTFVPDLNPQQFSYFVNKAKNRAFVELKQQQNVEAAGETRKQLISLQRRKNTSPDRPQIERLPRYGWK